MPSIEIASLNTPDVPIYMVADNNDTNKNEKKNLNLNELNIADLLVLFNILLTRCKELSAEQKYECCINAMKLVSALSALAPFVSRTQEFVHWMNQINWPGRGRQNTLDEDEDSDPDSDSEDELEPITTIDDKGKGKGKSKQRAKAPTASINTPSPKQGKRAHMDEDEDDNEEEDFEPEPTPRSLPLPSTIRRSLSAELMPPPGNFCRQLPSATLDWNPEAEWQAAYDDPCSHISSLSFESATLPEPRHQPPSSHFFGFDSLAEQFVDDIASASAAGATIPLRRYDVPEGRALRREYSFMEVNRGGEAELVSPHWTDAFRSVIDEEVRAMRWGGRLPVPLQVQYIPSLPMLRYDVESSRILHREPSFVEVNRGTYVEWVSPYLADTHTPLTARQRNASTDGLDLVPPIPGAMMPIYQYANAEVDEDGISSASDEMEEQSPSPTSQDTQETCEDSQATAVDEDVCVAEKNVKVEDGTSTPSLFSVNEKKSRKRRREDEDGDDSPRALTRMRSAEVKREDEEGDSGIDPRVRSPSPAPSHAPPELKKSRRSPRSKAGGPRRR